MDLIEIHEKEPMKPARPPGSIRAPAESPTKETMSSRPRRACESGCMFG